jgi:hypothetical protein
MDPLASHRSTAEELVCFARRQGTDLEPLRKDFTFQRDRRWICVWRKDLLPGTGPADEPLGTLHYSLQGTITVVPSRMKKSASAFRGAWIEAGTFESLEQAFDFVKAWLLDWKEVDNLPARFIRSYGI